MACLECRRRRIRCDSGRPKCVHCKRLSKDCEYAASEQRRGPKKRSVKELEQRLATVEAQLNAASTNRPPESSSDDSSIATPRWTALPSDFVHNINEMPWSGQNHSAFDDTPADFSFMIDSQDWPNTSNAIIALPTTSQAFSDTDKFPELHEVQELNQIFFDEVYPCVPFIHHVKHDPNRPQETAVHPPLCLRYVMWAHAAVRSSKFQDRSVSFYRTARMHLEHDEMQGDGLGHMDVSHVQTWLLIALFESETATPARAFVSSRRAIAMSQMLGLHRMDGSESSSGELCRLLHPPKDATEAEERRRTFWYAYYSDCWTSIGSGQGPSISEGQITTRLPASEQAFQEDNLKSLQDFKDATINGLQPSSPPIAAAVLTGWVLKKCTDHLRKAPDMKDDLQEQHFWLQHQQLDNTISRILMTLPDHLRATSTRDPLAFFVSMCLHGFTITLFQAAAPLAQKSPLKSERGATSSSRARRAAEQILEIMRAQAYMDIRKMCPFNPSCLYLAATVYIDDLNTGYQVENAREALLFILDTIRLFRKYWRAAQLFLAQLLRQLKDSAIDLGSTPADAMPLRCFTIIGEDFDALGPLFATGTLQGKERAKHILPDGRLSTAGDEGSVTAI